MFDVEIKRIVIEHKAEIKTCGSCGSVNVGNFPAGVSKAVQYGEGVKALSTYMSLYQLVPYYKRVEDFFRDQIRLPLSSGSIFNFNMEAFTKLEEFETKMKEELIESPLNHCDETGSTLMAKRHGSIASPTLNGHFGYIMATLIPALNSCLSRMTNGEKRFARRLEAKLEDDYLLWYDVSIGDSGHHPDFIILHPRRGILIIEVKDWKLESIQTITKTDVSLITTSGCVNVKNPFEQAREYAHKVVNLLEKDPALVFSENQSKAGKLSFPWSYGVALCNISRKQFESTDLGEILPSHCVICQDEMVETVEPEEFQKRLWEMFPWKFAGVLSLPQIDHIRGNIFPEIRLRGGGQQELFSPADPSQALPDMIRIMDLQQEQLARSLGDGHRVIHGVAGSGKTMILVYRCLRLAKLTRKPILVLCFNVPLATHLQQLIHEKGLAGQVTINNFHAWCRAQLISYHVPIPREEDRNVFFDLMVNQIIHSVDRGQIPSAQYGAVLIDEGHDFKPEWLKLAAQMVSPETNSLLLLYDDAQSIYGRASTRKFSFKSVGIQAAGRTTVLRINYRNTAEVLRVAYEFAKDVLTPDETDEDAIPLILPETAGRHGPVPELIKLPKFEKEVDYIVDRFRRLREDGARWRDMAVIYHSKFMGSEVAQKLRDADIPMEWLNENSASRRYHPDQESVKVVTLHSSKGLEFPIVAIPGVGFLPHKKAEPRDEVRLLYVGMTRAMDRLIMTCDRESAFTERLTHATERMAE